MKKFDAKLKALIDLQNCDTRITDIQRKKEEEPMRLRGLNDDLRTVEGKLDEELRQLETYKKERRQNEQNIDELDSRIEKSELKLSKIKSNKEYRAALKEIDDLKREKSLMEDKVIEIMELMEAGEERCADSKEETEKLKERFEKERQEILKKLKVLEKDLESLAEERAGLCQCIDEDLLKRYDYLKEHKGGLAISPVIKSVCQTCHLGIPPQRFNELIRGNELMSCPNCMRIIYWGEDERFQDGGEKS